MKFPKDEELFQAIPAGRNRRASYFSRTWDSTKEPVEPISAVFDRCYKEKAGETRAAHKGFIRDYGRDSEIRKDFDKIALELDHALQKHLDQTNGYIGEFPQSKKYYATVGTVDKEDYNFHYLGWPKYEIARRVKGYLTDINLLVYEEKYESHATKNALSLAAAAGGMALMWFFKGWFFTFEGLGLAKIAALTAIFGGLFALKVLLDDDSTVEEESLAGTLGAGLAAAVLVRIFLSGTTAATVCCVATGIGGVRFLAGLLKANGRLRQIRTRSPELGKLSANYRKWFEQEALSVYRMLRFLELWHESESGDAHKKNPQTEVLRRDLMKTVEEYEQWCRKYLRDGDAGF